jgi:hypothetical protein
MVSQDKTGRNRTARRAQATRTATTQETATAQSEAGTEQAETAKAPPGRALTVTVPLDRAIDVALLPVATARRVLSAKAVGVPVYVGLGVLAVADVIDPPVAAATGIGYAALRRWGPLQPAREAPGGQKERSSSRSGEE